MDFLWMLIVGFVVGAIAKFLMPGKDPKGFVVTSLLGIFGSVVAGYLGRSMNLYQQGEPVGFIASILGAMIILVLYRIFVGRKQV